MRPPGQGSIRRKLLALVLLPLVGVLPLLGVTLLWWSDSAIDELLVTKVRSDLAVARGYFERVLGEIGSGTQGVAESHQLRLAVDLLHGMPQGTPQDHARRALQVLLDRQRQRLGLTFLHWQAADGSLRVADWADRLPPLPEGALPDRSDPTDLSATVTILDRTGLARLAPSVLNRIGIPLVPTQGARRTERTTEDRAMVALAQAPMFDGQGRLLGVLKGGILLNRNLEFIDRINDIVYPAEALPFGSKGTATLFLDEVRISTNVRLFAPGDGDGDGNGELDADAARGGEIRAIGTRVSERVHQAVLDEGRTWLGRAFVVNEWYVSAYEPIQDAGGRPIGMLYVGFLERPFQVLKYAVLAAIGVLFFAVMVTAAWFSLRMARGIFRPIEQMEHTLRQVEAGDAQARVGKVTNEDEIGRLAQDLDHLLDTIADKTRTLEEWNAVLDRRVSERTADLQAAQEQLVRSEKMVVIGQLTAGVAHEINNPIAVIQGNLDLLRGSLGDAAEPVAHELALIDQQVERMRLIVSQMLTFARPGDYGGPAGLIDPVGVLTASLQLTAHTLRERGVLARSQCGRLPAVWIHAQELQQVLINLLVNAAHAMPEGGVVTLDGQETRLADGSPGVALTVADEGPGLPESVQHGLFQPFVTHKKDGTGLGLWISRTLVERWGGELRAANRSDAARGALFTVVLRTEALT